MDTNRHTNHVAIVTGAGSGIGAATAIRLAREGARVIAVDIASQAVTGIVADIVNDGGDATAIAGDVTQPADIQRILDAAGDKVDVLANVAGIMDHFVPLAELDDELWVQVIDVNLNGVMRLTRAVLPLMEAAGAGPVVTVGSLAADGGWSTA